MKKAIKINKLLEGIGSILSLFPRKNERKIKLPSSSIYTLLQNDWEKIGSDMWQVVGAIESQKLEKKNNRNNNDRFEKYSQGPPHR